MQICEGYKPLTEVPLEYGWPGYKKFLNKCVVFEVYLSLFMGFRYASHMQAAKVRTRMRVNEIFRALSPTR